MRNQKSCRCKQPTDQLSKTPPKNTQVTPFNHIAHVVKMAGKSVISLACEVPPEGFKVLLSH